MARRPGKETIRGKKIRVLCVGEGPRLYEAKLLNSSLPQVQFMYCRDELGQAMMPRGWQCKGVFWLPRRNLTLLDCETDTTGLGRVYVSVFIAHCGLL